MLRCVCFDAIEFFQTFRDIETIDPLDVFKAKFSVF